MESESACRSPMETAVPSRCPEAYEVDEGSETTGSDQPSAFAPKRFALRAQPSFASGWARAGEAKMEKGPLLSK